MRIIVTGGAGFIGSALCRFLVGETEHSILNLDKLTYAGTLESLRSIANNPRYRFVRADICDRPAIEAIFSDYRPDAVAHLAAESHVDRSITGSSAFVDTNITCSKSPVAGRERARPAPKTSGSFMYRLTKSTVRFRPADASARTPPTARTRPMRPPRHRPIIWSPPGTRPMGFRPSSPTALTITGRITFPRS
jgi:dTDP-glucose 4,6-dehydratase